MTRAYCKLQKLLPLAKLISKYASWHLMPSVTEVRAKDPAGGLKFSTKLLQRTQHFYGFFYVQIKGLGKNRQLTYCSKLVFSGCRGTHPPTCSWAIFDSILELGIQEHEIVIVSLVAYVFSLTVLRTHSREVIIPSLHPIIPTVDWRATATDLMKSYFRASQMTIKLRKLLVFHL